MWKILLVEDEPFVRKTIKNFVRWEDAGFQIAGEAENGTVALGLIEALKPDVVISDIVMPEMDGVTLLQQARARGFNGNFIMLTCINDFEYAQKAIEFGATGYVLKASMGVETFHHLLRKAQKELTLKEESAFRNRMQHHYRQAWEAISNDLPELTDTDCSLYRGQWILQLVTILHGNHPVPEEKLFLDIGLDQIGSSDLHRFTCLGITTLFIWRVKTNTKIIKGVYSFPFAVVYTQLDNVSQFPSVWRRMIDQLSESWYKGDSGIRQLDDNCADRAGHWPVSWEAERALLYYFEQLNYEKCSQLLQTTWDRMQELRVSIPVVKGIAVHLIGMFSRIAEYEVSNIEDCTNSTSHRQLLKVIQDTMKKAMAQKVRACGETTNNDEINKAIQYVRMNFTKNLTLKLISRHVSLGENYLCNLFKKKTGETLIHFVQRVRIDQAKLLLEQTDLSVNKISETVGIPSVTYFFKLFKRMEGTTPKEFRESLSNENS